MALNVLLTIDATESFLSQKEPMRLTKVDLLYLLLKESDWEFGSDPLLAPTTFLQRWSFSFHPWDIQSLWVCKVNSTIHPWRDWKIWWWCPILNGSTVEVYDFLKDVLQLKQMRMGGMWVFPQPQISFGLVIWHIPYP